MLGTHWDVAPRVFPCSGRPAIGHSSLIDVVSNRRAIEDPIAIGQSDVRIPGSHCPTVRTLTSNSSKGPGHLDPIRITQVITFLVNKEGIAGSVGAILHVGRAIRIEQAAG